MHLSAEECPHCGLTLKSLDALYDGFQREVNRPHDAAGVLRVKERLRVARWISRTEKKFPQLYFSVATVSLKGDQQIRSYGHWLMNRGSFLGVSGTARADGCVLIVIDVNNKEVCLHLGYLMDQHMRELESFEALVPAHPYLLESDYMRAIDRLLSGVSKYVKRLCRRAKREAKKSR